MTISINKYASNIYSQQGEDGIIARLLELIGDYPKWCVEFGAWDGEHLSNTHALTTKGWSGVFIEGDTRRFKDLQRTYQGNKSVYAINAYVGFDSPNDLDSLLAGTPIPIDFTVLSIDIDGNDYHAWESVHKYYPRIVIIEFNPTIPDHIEFVQCKDTHLHHGSSLKSLINLGKQKGYSLAATTALNAFFVRDDIFHRLEIEDNSIEALHTDRSYLMDVFQLYDGTLVFTGKQKMFWHGISLSKRQPIPKIFRKFPASMRPVRMLLFKIWRKIFDAR